MPKILDERTFMILNLILVVDGLVVYLLYKTSISFFKILKGNQIKDLDKTVKKILL